jgi:hypothetical protein
MICQGCGVEAPTKYVSFHQNIGVLVMRFSSSVEGNLCKSCINQHFWSMTGTTMFLGWWGVISFIITPFFLLNNIGRYLFALGLPPVPPGAMPPQLTDDAVAKIQPHLGDLFSRLEAGETFDTAVVATADRAGVTPGQVALFVHAVIQAQKEREGQQ